MTKKHWYDHAVTLAFTVRTPHQGDNVTEEELWEGLEKRIKDLKENKGEILEACLPPYDTYRYDPGTGEPIL